MILNRYILLCVFSFFYCYGFAQYQNAKHFADTTFICAGDSALIGLNDGKAKSEVNYYWRTPKGITVNGKNLYAKQQGLYVLKTITNQEERTDSTFLKLILPIKYFIRDTLYCGEPLTIINKNSNQNYMWITGESNDRIRINKPGCYWVKTFNKGCSFIDTFIVKTSNHYLLGLEKEITFCENEANKVLTVRQFPDLKYKWNTGETTTAIHPSQEGWYWIKSTSKLCGLKTDSIRVRFKNCDCEIFVKDSFTPNDDAKNDLFFPIFQCEYSYYLITITDRWGNTVYTSGNINGKWDGNFKRKPCQNDVYNYNIEAIEKNTDNKIIKKGRIYLLR